MRKKASKQKGVGIVAGTVERQMHVYGSGSWVAIRLTTFENGVVLGSEVITLSDHEARGLAARLNKIFANEQEV